MQKSFHKTLNDHMRDKKITIFTLSNDLHYDYVSLFKEYVNSKPSTELIISLNRYFKTAKFSQFAEYDY